MLIRWQDWLCALLGAWLVVSPWELDFSLDLAAKGNACGVGAVLIIFNLISACRKVDQGQEIVNILAGIWLILTPFAFNFLPAKYTVLNMTLSGAAVILLAAWQMWATIHKVEK